MMIFKILTKNDDYGFFKILANIWKIIHFSKLKKIYTMEVGVILVPHQCHASVTNAIQCRFSVVNSVTTLDPLAPMVPQPLIVMVPTN